MLTLVSIVCTLTPFCGLAGELTIVNASAQTLTCSIDGLNAPIHVEIRSTNKLSVPEHAPVDTNTRKPTLNYVDCGAGLRTRSMQMTADGSNRLLVFNGRQRRVLNALLYSSIPTDPKVGFGPLVRWLTQAYQDRHPEILLNLVLDPSVDGSYDFDQIGKLLGPQGVDVAELDTVFLKYLVDSDSILPLSPEGIDAWPVAKEAATLRGVSYGIPSWLSSDFLFSLKPEDRVTTFDQLRSFLDAGAPTRILEADFASRWTILALYIQAYTQMHHSRSATDAITHMVDSAVVTRMAQVAISCERKDGNPCIDNRFHEADDGTVEREFNSAHALADIGFSERSFYLEYYAKSRASLQLTPFPWGDDADAAHLIYVDAFVVNAHACREDPCKDQATQLARFMNEPDTQERIAFSLDLPAGSPARHLLPASQAFYKGPTVIQDPIYRQVQAKLFSKTLLPYPNSITPARQYKVLTDLCDLLTAASPGWSCITPEPPATVFQR